MSRTCFESLVTKNDGSDPFKLDGSKSDETDADEYESSEFLGGGSPPEVQSSTKKKELSWYGIKAGCLPARSAR